MLRRSSVDLNIVIPDSFKNCKKQGWTECEECDEDSDKDKDRGYCVK